MNAIPNQDFPIVETFVKALELFSVANSVQKQTDLSIFTFPIIQDSQINEIKKMLSDGVSISGCCKYVSAMFSFDPAFVNAIENQQISPHESKLGLIANTIAWAGSDKFCTCDFFFLLVRSIISAELDNIRKACIRIIIDHYRHILPLDMSEDAICLLSKFFISKSSSTSYSISDQFFFVDIMHDILKISIKVGQTNITNISINTLSSLIHNNEYIFAQYNFKPLLCSTCKDLIQDLNINVLSLLGIIADVNLQSSSFLPNNSSGNNISFNINVNNNVNMDFLSDCFVDLANVVVKKLAKTGTKIEVNVLTPVDLFSEFITDCQMNFESFKFCQPTINTLSNECFDSSLTAVDVLNSNQFEILNAFQPLLHMKQQNFTILFLSTFGENLLTNNYIETFIFYLSILKNLPELESSQTICESIIKSDIFSPKFTLFYDLENFQKINLLRNLSFNFINNSHPKMISNILTNATNYPFLFAEHISRLHSQISLSKFQNFLIPIIISNISIVLQKLVSKMAENTADLPQVHNAWSSLFVCINELLNDPSIAISLFTSFEFTNVYMRHFFYEPLRPLVFASLRRYLTQPDAFLCPVAQFCLGIYRYTLFSDEKFHNLMTELLACLEDSIIHRQEILKDLSMITPALLSFFLHFPTKNLLKNTLNFLLLVSFNCDNFSFSHDEMLSLGKTIREMESDGLSDNTFSIMLSLLAGKKINNITQTFAIKNPSFILLILDVSADDISQSIQFFLNLCKYSIFNCVQCHKGELDLLLIELVKHYPNSFEFLDCTFNSTFSEEELSSVVLQLLSLIFTYQCSPQSIERFIGLAVPVLNSDISEKPDSTDIFSKLINLDTTFPQFSDVAVNQLITTMTNLHELHYVFTPSSTPLVFSDISFEEISNGFSFSCYLMVDSAISQSFSEKPLLFQIKDDKNATLTLYSSGSTILCEIRSDWGTSSASLTTDFPSCEWTMITVTIHRKTEIFLLLEFALNKDQGPPFTIRDPAFTGHVLTAQIGGFMPNSERKNNNVSCFLGPFHLFNVPLNGNQISSLYSIGIKSLDSNKDLLSIQDINVSCNTYIKAFSYVFKNYELVRTLIPFFAFSKSAPHFFLEKIVDFFRYIEPEQSTRYFSIISQFLMKAPPNVIAYSLYLRFFTLYTEIPSDELFKHILFNFDIWFNAEDPQTVKRTVHHWATVLFPDFYLAFLKNTTFSEILTYIRIHCWFTEEERDMINLNRCKTIDINVVRNSLNRLLAKYASMKLSQEDIDSLLSHIFTIHDTQQKLSYLSLLTDISSLVIDKNEVAEELHMLFTKPRADLFYATLNLILLLSESKRDEHIENILFHISKQHLTVQILDSVLECSKVFSEAIPIACLIACSLNENERLKTIEMIAGILDVQKAIEFQTNLGKIKSWFIWMVNLMVTISSRPHQSMLVRSIVSVMFTNRSVIDDVLGYLDLIFINFGIKVTTFQLEIIDFICREILVDQSPNKINETMYRFSRYLLFHFDSNIHSEQLLNDYEHSPFSNMSNEGNVFIHYVDSIACPNQRQRTLSANFDFNLYSMTDVQALFSNSKMKMELIFRVDVDIDNIGIFDRIVANIDQIQNISFSDENLNHYIKFLKYLKNKHLINELDRYRIMQNFSLENWRNFQVMNIAFKNFINRFCFDFDKFYSKISKRATELLSNFNEKTINISLLSADTIQERKLSQYAQDANYFNIFAFQVMNGFSIWKQFSETSILNSEEEKSFHILENFACPYNRKRLNLFQIEIDPVVIRTKPVLCKPAKLMKINNEQHCTFIVFPTNIMIVTKLKCIVIQLHELSYILYRHANCFEFLMKYGKSYVVNFLGTPVEDIAKAFKQTSKQVEFSYPTIQTVSFSKFIHKLNFTNDWVNGKITNYEYLLKLNFMGGRSYQMLANYPVFPFVRDFSNSNGVGYLVSPQVWLKMFSPFSACFNLQLQKTQHSTKNSITSNNGNISDSYNSSIDKNDFKKNEDEVDNVQFEFRLSTDSIIDLCEEDEQIDDSPITSVINENDITISSSINNNSTIENEEENNSLPNSDLFLNTLEMNKFELTPEFYNMPECFAAPLRLPNGVSKFEFIYENRKQLESEIVSNSLNIWIDRLFGPSGLVAPLFKSPHPVKNSALFIQAKKLRRQPFSFNITSEGVVFGKIDINNFSEKIYVKTLSSQGNYTESAIDLSKISIETTTPIMIPMTPHTVVSATRDELVLINPETLIMSIVKNGKIAKTPISLSAEFSEDEAVFGSVDGTVFAVETVNNKCYIQQVKVTPEIIVSIHSSKIHGITAVSVRSGKIILFKKFTGEYLRVIDTNGVPAKRILITESFGYLVAEFPNEIAVFSISGEKIRSQKIEYEINYMNHYMSDDGFDYLIIVDTIGKIIIFEVFKLNIIQKINHKLNCRILYIKYIPSIGGFILITQDGNLLSLK